MYLLLYIEQVSEMQSHVETYINASVTLSCLLVNRITQDRC